MFYTGMKLESIQYYTSSLSMMLKLLSE